MREMKNSGVAWIGEIPEEYSVVAVKNMFEIGRGRVIAKTELCDAGYPVYSSQTKNDGCLGYINTYDFDRDQLTWTTDGANAGTIFLRRGKHNCTNVCGTLLPKSNDICLEYQRYALWYIALHHKRADTNGFKIMNNEMAAIKTVVPPKNEQKRIAGLLDDKCSKVDVLIANQEAQIEKLKQYKQSLITEVVTKGLNPDTEKKDSAVPEIGYISKEHSLRKTLFCLEMPITDGPHTTPELFDEGIPFVSAEAVSCGNGSIDFEHIRGYVSQEFYDECCKKYIPKIDDIYMIKSGATTGKVSIVDTDKIFTIWSPLAVFRCKKDVIIPKYMFYYLQSKCFQQQVELGWTYGTQQNIGMRTLEKLKVVVPFIEDQEKIIDYLDTQCKKVNKLIELKQSKIAKLNEYKKSLIYEYVTGKKEVV